MNYLRVYCNLIRKAEQRDYTKKKAKELGIYEEGHHVFPRSIFGQTKEGNKRIVYLTAREHYISHALLERICLRRYGENHWKTKKMMCAFWCMNAQKSRNTYLNSYFYENSRVKYSNYLKELMTGRVLSEESKKKISLNNKGKVKTEEHRRKISISRIGFKPSRESVEKTRIKNIGKKRTKEHCEYMSKIRKGIRVIPLKVEDEDFKNKFVDAVKTSKTKREIIRKMGMKTTSGSSALLIDKWVDYLNLDMSHLLGRGCPKGRTHTKETREKMSLSQKGKTLSEEQKKKIKLSNCKYVYTFISPEGTITETILCSDFCKKHKLNLCKIREVARGIRVHHKKWKASRRLRTEEDK